MSITLDRLERSVPSPDADATRRLGTALASMARPGDVVALYGELGAGKTVLAKGFASGLGVRQTVNSPSFVLMAEYRGRLPLFHLDLYRLADASEALAGGLLDERQGEGVTLIEWAERLDGALPGARLDVTIEGTGDEPRRIHVRARDEAYARFVEAVT
jgi:tRNA threonylcarbamoyladenosine biosynthesis protein TsaE